MSKDIRWNWLQEKGIKIDDNLQKNYLEDVWDKRIQIVFNDSPAGTGKTTIPTLALAYEVGKGTYDKLIYVRSAVPVREQGFLKGDLKEKEYPYFSPFIDTLDKVERGYFEKWSKPSIENKQPPRIIATTSSFLRGIDWSRAAIIIDEAQNFSLTELRTVLTRPHDDCKIVVIGSSRQIDNRKDLIQGRTAFEMYLEYFKRYDSAGFHTLAKNYRGRLSQFADDFAIPDGVSK